MLPVAVLCISSVRPSDADARRSHGSVSTLLDASPPCLEPAKLLQRTLLSISSEPEYTLRDVALSAKPSARRSGAVEPSRLHLFVGAVDEPDCERYAARLRGREPRVGPDLRLDHVSDRRLVPEHRTSGVERVAGRPRVDQRPLLAGQTRHADQTDVVERVHRRRLSQSAGASCFGGGGSLPSSCTVR